MYKVRWALMSLIIVMAFSWTLAGVAIIEANVDGSDYLVIKGANVTVIHRNFEPLTELRYRFDPYRGIPDGPTVVRLKKLEGSGPVTIIEQPSESNGYSLKILIDNDNEDVYPQRYRIKLEWNAIDSELFSSIDRKKYDYLHWRGIVDGTDIVKVSRSVLSIKHIRARYIKDQRFDFSSPLPDREVNVRLRKVRGRGKITLLEQPSYENNYTALVRLDDGPYRGSSVYDFYLYWEKSIESNRTGDYDFIWEGVVDGKDRLVIRGSSVSIEHLRADPIKKVHYEFKTALPKIDQNVKLHVFRGRGKVWIEQQPQRWNNYTLKVIIDDSRKGGDYRYKIGLGWKEEGRSYMRRRSSSQIIGSGGVIRWSGRVDGKDILKFHQRSVTVDHIAAKKIKNMNVTFSDPLPRHKVHVTLNKIHGRGKVRIIEQPSPQNRYTIMVEVSDAKGGSDYYEFELVW